MTSNIRSSWDSTFETKSALSGFYIWLLFGFLSISVSCDIQKWMSNKIWFRHLMGVVAFFFLFAVIDTTSSNYNVCIIWAKTLIVYFIFLLMTKSRGYFSIPVLILLVIDQTIKSQINYMERNKRDTSQLETMRNIITVLIAILIVIGFVDYIFHQKSSYSKEEFKYSKLLFGYGCQSIG